MILIFKPPKDATLFDVVINTYGTLDLVGKFILDNNIININGLASGKEQFIYDYALVNNYNQYLDIIRNNLRFVTSQEFFIQAQPEANFLLTESSNVLQAEGGDDFLVEE